MAYSCLSLLPAIVIVAGVRLLRVRVVCLPQYLDKKKKQSALATCTRFHVARYRGIVASRRVRAT